MIQYQTLRVATPPAVEPVTVSEAKAHLRVDTSDDDTYIGTLITAAREWVESYLDRALITQQLVMTREVLDDELYLPRPPMAVTGTATAVSITYTAPTGDTATLSTATYRVSRYETPGEITPVYGTSWPANIEDENAVTVTWWAGYGLTGSSVPAVIRHAMLMLVGHWYESRQAAVATGAVPQDVPYGVKSLLDSSRWMSYR